MLLRILIPNHLKIFLITWKYQFPITSLTHMGLEDVSGHTHHITHYTDLRIFLSLSNCRCSDLVTWDEDDFYSRGEEDWHKDSILIWQLSEVKFLKEVNATKLPIETNQGSHKNILKTLSQKTSQMINVSVNSKKKPQLELLRFYWTV